MSTLQIGCWPVQDKAPGSNKVPNRFLRVINATFSEQIKHLFQACFTLGYYLRRFKEANTIILKKPKKPDYIEPKVYRLIVLLNILGKAFEAVIVVRLRDCTKANSLLPKE